MNPSEVGPSITLLCGLPGSGKSTYVRNYVKDHPETVVISSDDIIQSIADSNNMTYNQVWKTHRDQAESEYKANLLKAISEKKTIIVDRTNLTVKSRRKILANVPKSYNKYAVVFSVVDDELKRRLLQRAYETDKSIPDDVLDTMRVLYSEPSKEESFDGIIKMGSIHNA